MNIAVTGGNGRVGQAVITHALAQGHTVRSIDQTAANPAHNAPQLTHIQADVTDYTALESALQSCDALIHLAAIPSPGKHPDYVVHNNNVVGSYNALSAAARLGIRRVAQASSINAIGAVFSQTPQFDYLPIDEAHPTYNEDPYSLSKWICELQADSMTRRHPDLTAASLRIHWSVEERIDAVRREAELNQFLARQLWGYTRLESTARAFLLALTADFKGHEVFFIVAPDTMVDTPSQQLKEVHYPDVPLREELVGNQGFFNCRKAKQLLDWTH
jgi:nucleoside-diphosphate-sugar epimerase